MMTPPTPGLTESERSAATSPSGFDDHVLSTPSHLHASGHARAHAYAPADARTSEAAWKLHETLTRAAYTQGWSQEMAGVHQYQHFEPEEASVYVHPQQRAGPGVGPRGHALGGMQMQPKLPYAPAPAQLHVQGRGQVQAPGQEQRYSPTTSPSRSPSAYVPPGGEYFDPNPNLIPRLAPVEQPFNRYDGPGPGYAYGAAGPAHQASPTRAVGPSGHVLGGARVTPSPSDVSSEDVEVIYDTSHTQSSPVSPSRHGVLGGSPPRNVTRPKIVVQGPASSNLSDVASKTQIQTRPRALSRRLSMNLRLGLDTVMEVEEPVPSPRVANLPMTMTLAHKRTRSFPIREEEDVEAYAEAEAEGEVVSISSSVSEVSAESPVLRTPRDDEIDSRTPIGSAGDRDVDGHDGKEKDSQSYHESVLVAALDNLHLAPIPLLHLPVKEAIVRKANKASQNNKSNRKTRH
jgi:hypothetical protein